MSQLYLNNKQTVYYSFHGGGRGGCLQNRYVDDTFCLFNNETDALEFFHYINDKHPNITFTMETEVNQKLPFLDVLLDNSNPPSLVTSVFRKSTYTGLSHQFS